MTKAVLTIIGILVLTGCTEKSVWPPDVKPGVEIEFGLGAENGSGRGKVVGISGDWLAVETHGKTVQLPREKILTLRVIAE
jgi:hypothetical protein